MPEAGKIKIHTTRALEKLRLLLRKEQFHSCIILCDDNTLAACMPLLLESVPELATAEVIEIESGEQSKSIEVCAGIWQSLIEQCATKRTLLINLGGGVVCDIGGFCSAVFKRGIPFINVPTSLLCMADAAIGGKTGVDLANIKNVIGTFSDPLAVFIDHRFLRTLPARELRNGFAEVMKVALAHDAKFFGTLLASKKEPSLAALVHKAANIKLKVVQKDPYEKDLRKTLNFGHTIGHALESFALSGGHDLLHGEAVAAGMIVECSIALRKKVMTQRNHQLIVNFIASRYRQVPFSATYDQLKNYLRNDKKKLGREMRFALVTKPGHCKTDVNVDAVTIRAALSDYQKIYAAH